MSASESIILGILSGILTTLFISIIIAIFNKTVIPWYRKMIYSGTDISGEWKCTQNNTDIKESLIMIISQKSEKITCLLTITKHFPKGKIDSKTVKLYGEFENRFLSLRGKNINKKYLGVNVMLLELIHGGNRLSGFETWYSTTSDKIESEKVLWIRSDIKH